MQGKLWRQIASVRFEVKLQDAWIGAYWKRDLYALHIWICFVPCLPLHIIVL